MKEKQLVNVLSQDKTRYYLSMAKSEDLITLMSNSGEEQVYINQVHHIFNLLQNDKLQFDDLVKQVISKANESLRYKATKTLKRIQKVLKEDFIFEGHKIGAQALATKTIQLESTENISVKFNIGIYSAQLENNETNEGPDVKYTFSKKKRVVGRSGIYSGFRRYGILPNWFLRKQDDYETLIDQLDCDLSCFPWKSFLGIILSDLAKKQKQELPENFGWDYSGKLHLAVDRADKALVQRILHKEYASQKINILPEAVFLLHRRGRDFLGYIEGRLRFLDASVNFLSRLNSMNYRSRSEYTILRVPSCSGVETKPQKVFLVVYDERKEERKGQFEAIVKVLSLAGWGDSLIIGTENFYVMNRALDTQKIDYFIQGGIALHHEKILWESDIQSREDGGNWEDKIMLCYAENESSSINMLAQDFTKEKIEHNHY